MKTVTVSRPEVIRRISEFLDRGEGLAKGLPLLSPKALEFLGSEALEGLARALDLLTNEEWVEAREHDLAAFVAEMRKKDPARLAALEAKYGITP